MSTENEEIDSAAAQLAEEISRMHTAIMTVHRYAEADDYSIDWRVKCTVAAARLMQVQANAALSLRRLKSNEAAYAFRYIREGVPPTPRKSKTNGNADTEDAIRREANEQANGVAAPVPPNGPVEGQAPAE